MAATRDRESTMVIPNKHGTGVAPDHPEFTTPELITPELATPELDQVLRRAV